jgi:hypothetical protein
VEVRHGVKEMLKLLPPSQGAGGPDNDFRAEAMLSAELFTKGPVRAEVGQVKAVVKQAPVRFGYEAFYRRSTAFPIAAADKEDTLGLPPATKCPSAEFGLHPEMDTHHHGYAAQSAQVLTDGVNVLFVAVNELDAVPLDQTPQPPERPEE